MNYAAVIFDLDGTLLDTLADIAAAANRVLAARSLPTHEVEAYRQFVGNGVEVLMQRILPSELRDAETIATSSAEFRHVYAETWNLSTSPYPGIPDVLSALNQRQLRLAVLSNKPHANAVVCVNEFFAPETFDVVFGQRDEVPCKPNPAAAVEIAAALDLPPRKFLFVGDSDVDMQTAENAGMTGIGAAWGFRSRAELIASGARRVIDHPGELLELG